MALRPEEILRIKYQLGVSVTLIGAEPYITYLAVFDKAIQPYIIDPSTTSTTAVVAGTTQAITVAAIASTTASHHTSGSCSLLGGTVSGWADRPVPSTAPVARSRKRLCRPAL